MKDLRQVRKYGGKLPGLGLGGIRDGDDGDSSSSNSNSDLNSSASNSNSDSIRVGVSDGSNGNNGNNNNGNNGNNGNNNNGNNGSNGNNNNGNNGSNGNNNNGNNGNNGNNNNGNNRAPLSNAQIAQILGQVSAQLPTLPPYDLTKVNTGVSTILQGVGQGSLAEILRGSFAFTRNDNVASVANTVIDSIFGKRDGSGGWAQNLARGK